MHFNHDGFRYTFYRTGFQKRNTSCRISLVDSEGKEAKILASGEARLNPKDKYSKKIGRRVALQKALASLDAPHGIKVQVNQILSDIEKLESQGL